MRVCVCVCVPLRNSKSSQEVVDFVRLRLQEKAGVCDAHYLSHVSKAVSRLAFSSLLVCVFSPIHSFAMHVWLQTQTTMALDVTT